MPHIMSMVLNGQQYRLYKISYFCAAFIYKLDKNGNSNVAFTFSFLSCGWVGGGPFFEERRVAVLFLTFLFHKSIR